MEDCVFCKVITGQLPGTFLYKDDDVVVFADIHPQASVHWLVVSKKHITEFIESQDELLSKMVGAVKRIIEQEGIANYRIVINGKGAALIDHVHVHVMGGVDKLRKL